VPAAVQQTADTQAKGGKIVRWEKEGANFEPSLKEWQTMGRRNRREWQSREQARREQRAQRKRREILSKRCCGFGAFNRSRTATRPIAAGCLKVRFFPKGGIQK